MSLKLDRVENTAILTIDRPDARNAIDPATTRAFDDAFDELEADHKTRVVVITGAGSEAFCSGVDLKIQAQEGVNGVVSAKGGFAGVVQRQFTKPLIAAVNGHALGGGLEIMLACDMAVAAEHALLGATEVRFGQIADGGSLIRLPNRVPPAIAAELVLTGEPITALRAAHWGLVNQVVKRDGALDHALELASRISGNPAPAVRLSKSLLRRALSMPEAVSWEMNSCYSELIHATADWVEGPRAFADKRSPQWEDPTVLAGEGSRS